ncbi:hypothetical protein P0Y35_16250 [Kiritimatiellaeota bacterium B1221]|nr:hypothetical protein [Kiritimatiellaeota bacterium B1221]
MFGLKWPLAGLWCVGLVKLALWIPHHDPLRFQEAAAHDGAMLFIVLPLLILSFVLAMLCANFLVFLVPPAREVFCAEAGGNPKVQYDASQKMLLKLAMGIACMAIPISLVASGAVLPQKKLESSPKSKGELMEDFQTEFIFYTSLPIELPHQKGGVLRISTAKIRTGLSIKVLKFGAEQSDVLQISKAITDERGQTHIFTTHLSAYDLWGAVSDGVSYTEEYFMQSWRFQEGTTLIPLAQNIYVWSDGRDARLMGLQVVNRKNPYLFEIPEKYFNATLDLFIVRRPPQREGDLSVDRVVARIKGVQTFRDATGEFEWDGSTPIIVDISSDYLLFKNNLRYSVLYEEEGPQWNRTSVSEPIEVQLGEMNSGGAQKGVSWVK